MERLNNEIRSREKTMRGLKKDTPVIDGYQIYHNYIREHMALDGLTAAKVAGIKVEGKNKWITLIQMLVFIRSLTNYSRNIFCYWLFYLSMFKVNLNNQVFI